MVVASTLRLWCAGRTAEAGSEALLGMRPALQNELAQSSGCRPNEGGISADTADSPVGVAAMTGRHMIGQCGALAVAAPPHVHGNPLAPDENLHCAAGEAHLDLAAREAVGNAVGPRHRRGNRCRPGARAIRRRHKARSARASAPAGRVHRIVVGA